MRRRFSSGTILIGKNSLLREGLAKILHSANFRITASVSCADDLLASKGLPGQLLFLIFHIGDDIDAAIKQVELIRNRHPGGRIGIVTDRYRLEELILAFRSGANGYFVNVMTCDVFIKSLELMMMGETVFPPEFLSFFLDSDRHQTDEPSDRNSDRNNETIVSNAKDPVLAQLSPREQTILRCLIDGDSNKSIGRKFDIAEATVKVHVKAILRKIQVHNRTQAAIWWINNGSPGQQVADKPAPANKLADDLGEISEISHVTAPLSPITNKQYAVRPIGKGVSDLRTDSLVRFRK
jgi:DNA-binding NarL/FixJ family response regulator